MLYLVLNNIEKAIEDKSTQSFAVTGVLMALYLLQMIYVAIYRFKSPWYNPVFSPPDYYQRGTFLEDQGNNI